jgi:hypothetical protein
VLFQDGQDRPVDFIHAAILLLDYGLYHNLQPRFWRYLLPKLPESGVIRMPAGHL